jgi:hypothetical protein
MPWFIKILTYLAWFNMKDVTSGAGTAYPPRAPEFITPSFSGLRVAQSLVFFVMFCRWLFVLLSSFLLAIVLSVLLWVTASGYPGYPFVIFRLFSLSLLLYNYITSVFHWNVTIWLVMKWSHDYKRDVLHPNKTQTRTCTCFHDDVRCKQSMV